MENVWSSRITTLLSLVWIFNCCYLPSTYAEPSQESYAEELEYESNQPDNNNPYHDKRVVDSKGKYTMEWTVDYHEKLITFNVTVKTTGWVGIGFSKDGTMKNADIVIGWVGINGQGFLVDLHSDHNRKLATDKQQNWKLVTASEIGGKTNLIATRTLDTCDHYDYHITTDLIWVLWAYGETDEFGYHFDKRGSFRAYLLDPVQKSFEPHLKKFRVAREFNLKSGWTTSYMCSIHKAPKLHHKHHIVETHPFFLNTLSDVHSHHMFVYRCVAPPGMNAKEIFEPLLDLPGEECYFNPHRAIPVHLCQLLTAGWAKGAHPLILPNSTGFPLGESIDEYYMLEVHYDNPEGLPLQVSSGFDLYYANRLRANDGGIIMVAYDVYGVFMIPPISRSFQVYGFCSEDCSQSFVPEDGYEISAVFLHTHYTGRRVKLQHFRNGKELEWILKEDNYDPSYQQFRHLYEPRLVLPGDLLVVKCEYDNTKKPGTTLSGFATSEEMCVAGLVISKRLPWKACASQVTPKDLLSIIGVEDYEWDINTGDRFITAPPTLAGKPLIYASDNLTDWTKALRSKLQQVQLTAPNIATCPPVLIPTPRTSTQLTSTQTLEQQEHEATLIQEEQQKLVGTIISSSEKFENILTLAKGYGTDTLMGDNQQLPTRTPGSTSSATYPFRADRYSSVRSCPKATSTPNHSVKGRTSGGTGGYQPYSVYPIIKG